MIQTAYGSDNLSNLWTTFSNFGNYGDPHVPEGRPSMEWPGSSGIHYLWEGRLWIGAIVDGEKRVSHADYGQYEFHPDGAADAYTPLGLNHFEYETSFNDLVGPHTTAPLNIKINQLSKLLPYTNDEVLTNTAIIKQDIVNIGTENLNDLIVSFVFDCDVGTGFGNRYPHIDDLVDYDGWDGEDSDTDLEDIVENYDWNGNGVLDGYDENGIPYGWEFYSSEIYPNPNYNEAMVSPDGFPDEYQVIVTENDTIVLDRQMSYMYDGDNPSTPEDDTAEEGHVKGFIGLRTMKKPVENVLSHQWWNWESNPYTDREKYDYMAGVHPASDGYLFIPNPLHIDAPPFDYHFMYSMGDFDVLTPNDTLKLVTGIAVGKGIMGLRQNMDALYIYCDSTDIDLSTDDKDINIPSAFKLYANYPNPFNPITIIGFELQSNSEVNLNIYNLRGQLVDTILNEHISAGYHKVIWNARNYPSGIYFARLTAGDYSATQKMILLK